MLKIVKFLHFSSKFFYLHVLTRYRIRTDRKKEKIMLKNVQPATGLITFKGIKTLSETPAVNDNPEQAIKSQSIIALRQVRKLAKTCSGKDKRVYISALRRLLKRMESAKPKINLKKKSRPKSNKTVTPSQMERLRTAFFNAINQISSTGEATTRTLETLCRYRDALERENKTLKSTLKKVLKKTRKQLKR